MITKGQFSKFLKLSQYEKLCFIEQAKDKGMDKHSMYWLELAYAVNDPKIIRAMYKSIA